jgi:hypothetical protein
MPNGLKIIQGAMKHASILIRRPSKIYPIWDFWFENIPSGNTAPEASFLKPA